MQSFDAQQHYLTIIATLVMNSSSVDINDHAVRKSVFISLCGRPNVGKSTLLNTMLKCKLSAISPKAQTTRNCINGVITEGNVQLVFTDTPGLFNPKKSLEHMIVRSAYEGARNAQQICLLVEPSSNIKAEVQELLHHLPEIEKPLIIVINKIDLFSQQQVLSTTAKLSRMTNIGEIFMISAKSGLGVEPLKDYLASQAIEDQWYYDAKPATTDRDAGFLTAEITRELIFNSLHDELHYATHVTTDSIQYQESNIVEIQQTIYVQKDGQKAIILGAKGQKIKDIARKATAAIGKLLGDKSIKLSLCVKVKSNWADHWQD